MNRKVVVAVVGAIISSCLFPRCTCSQSEQPRKLPKKVWTNDDLAKPSLTIASPGSEPAEANLDSKDASIKLHYLRSKDPNWYAKQLTALRKQIDDIDHELRATAETVRSGKGGSVGIALDKPREAATTDAQVEILRKRRLELVTKVNDLEFEAAKNDIAPGELRREVPDDTSSAAPAREVEGKSLDVKEAERTLKDQKEHLKRAKNELDLLSRRLDLDQREVYSNPNYSLNQTGEAKLNTIKQQIEEKRAEIGLVEQDIAESEDHIEELKLNQAANKDDAKKQDDSASVAAKEEKGEQYWRKRFAEARYKLRIAEEERDILQRELGVLVVQYDPNPAKALFEGATNKKINEHRKAIEDKKAEITTLQQQLSDLEDELRRAGGYPGWAR
jgi:prefoldin subunit 5